MGYAVAYEPTWKRKKKRNPRPVRTIAARQVKQNARERRKAIRQAVRWNVAELEHDTIGTDNISASMLAVKLRFTKIAPDADPSGGHVVQQLVSEGVLTKPVRRSGGERVFERAVLLRELKAWAGAR